MAAVFRKTFVQLSGFMPQLFKYNNRAISRLIVHKQTPEEVICRYECIFNNPETDGWDVRQAMNDLAGYDAVPDPKIIIAALKACRRLNDYALSVRFLEVVKDKCGNQVDKIYPYIKQEICTTVRELGCDFPEDLGYDKPELYLKSVFDLDYEPPSQAGDGDDDAVCKNLKK